MIKRIIFFLLILIVLFFGVYFIFGLPLIIEDSNNKTIGFNHIDKDSFNPLEQVDFSSDNIVMYLLFSKEDIKELPSTMNKQKLLKCSDKSILKDLKNNFYFTKSNGDMATCESEILVYKNDVLILSTRFAFTDKILGIQNNKVGWANAVNRDKLGNILLKFNSVNKLFVKL